MRKLLCFSILVLLTACTNNTSSPEKTDLPLLPTNTLGAIIASISPTEIPFPYPTLVPESAFIKGITLNEAGLKLNSKEAYSVIDQYIIPSGANYVALIPTCFSEDYNDPEIICDDRSISAVSTPTDREIIDVIKRLHSSGLRVVLKPQALVMTELVENRYDQRGKNWNDNQWDMWFQSYKDFISHYAELAENNDVDLLVIGNEQQDTTQYEEEWREIIGAVRSIYRGPITYAANSWQFEASKIRFWDALDFIGTNGYFGYVNSKESTIDDMKNAWVPILKELEIISNEYEKPVLITEIGASSTENNNTGQLTWWTSGKVSIQEQADYYQAFYESLMDASWLKGIIIWGIDTNPFQGGEDDTSSTYIGKPAQQLVHQYFGGIEILQEQKNEDTKWVEDPDSSTVIYDDLLRNGWKQWSETETQAAELDADIAYQGNYSIHYPLSDIPEVQLYFDTPYVDMSNYQWIEFYIYVEGEKPSTIFTIFAYWTPQSYLWSQVVNINNPDYLESDSIILNEWNRVRIPLEKFGITDHIFTELHFTNRYQNQGGEGIENDVYFDNIRLIAAMRN